MNEDLYNILGVEKTCSREEIKKAYKKAAIKYHPDKLKADATEDEKSKFVKIQQAYEILYDDEKRQTYDMYGTTDEQHTQHDFMKDIFSMLFQGARDRQQKIPEIKPTIIEVCLEIKEIITGVEKHLSFERNVLVEKKTNRTTQPDGIIYKCELCKGSGMMVKTIKMGHIIQQNMSPCDKCGASGYINSRPSEYKFTKKKCEFDYKFNKGIKSREVIKLTGLGDINPLDTKHNGDIIIIVYHKDSDKFKLDAQGNLLYTQTISIFESITGTELSFAHIDGRKIIIRLPPVMPEFKKIIKRLGIPQHFDDSKELYMTDLIIDFNIIYPVMTPKEIKFLRDNFNEYYHDREKPNGDEIILNFSN